MQQQPLGGRPVGSGGWTVNSMSARLVCCFTIRRVLLVVAALALAGIVAHRQLLTAAAGLLVVDQTNGKASDVLVLGGDRCHAVAADVLKRNPTGHVLLIEAVPSRLVECGILPAQHLLDRQALKRQGVSESSIELIPGQAESPWDAARLLGQWLRAHPEATTAVLCYRFCSRQQRAILDQVLDPEEAGRVCVWPLADRRYDETNWWQERTTAREFVYAWIRLAAFWMYGEQQSHGRWDPDAYEQRLHHLAAVGQ